jgi:hypothetical protein
MNPATPSAVFASSRFVTVAPRSNSIFWNVGENESTIVLALVKIGGFVASQTAAVCAQNVIVRLTLVPVPPVAEFGEDGATE